MSKRFFYVCAGLLCLASGVVHAQTAPANIRDGCVTGTVDPSLTVDVDLFSVPDGMDFVLTDRPPIRCAWFWAGSVSRWRCGRASLGQGRPGLRAPLMGNWNQVRSRKSCAGAIRGRVL